MVLFLGMKAIWCFFVLFLGCRSLTIFGLNLYLDKVSGSRGLTIFGLYLNLDKVSGMQRFGPEQFAVTIFGLYLYLNKVSGMQRFGSLSLLS